MSNQGKRERKKYRAREGGKEEERKGEKEGGRSGGRGLRIDSWAGHPLPRTNALGCQEATLFVFSSCLLHLLWGHKSQALMVRNLSAHCNFRSISKVSSWHWQLGKCSILPRRDGYPLRWTSASCHL